MKQHHNHGIMAHNGKGKKKVQNISGAGGLHYHNMHPVGK